VRLSAHLPLRRDIPRPEADCLAGAPGVDGQWREEVDQLGRRVAPVNGNLAAQQSVPRASTHPDRACSKQQGWRPTSRFPARCWRSSGRAASGPEIQVPPAPAKPMRRDGARSQRCLAEAKRQTAEQRRHGPAPASISPRCAALSRDLALRSAAYRGYGLAVACGIRNGDTPSAERAANLKNPPQILITTPESLSCCWPARPPRAVSAPLTRGAR